MPRNSVLEHRVTDAVHLRHREQQQAEQHAPRGRAQPIRPAPQPVGNILARVEHPDEPQTDAARQDSQTGVEDQLDRRAEAKPWKREERVASERRSADRVRGGRAEHD